MGNSPLRPKTAPRRMNSAFSPFADAGADAGADGADADGTGNRDTAERASDRPTSRRKRRSSHDWSSTNDGDTNNNDATNNHSKRSNGPNNSQGNTVSSEGTKSSHSRSKRIRRPPQQYVARPSKQGLGVQEGDELFLNDDVAWSTKHRASGGTTTSPTRRDSVKIGEDISARSTVSNGTNRKRRATSRSDGGSRKRIKMESVAKRESAAATTAIVGRRTSALSRRYVLSYFQFHWNVGGLVCL